MSQVVIQLLHPEIARTEELLQAAKALVAERTSLPVEVHDGRRVLLDVEGGRDEALGLVLAAVDAAGPDAGEYLLVRGAAG
jgi:hypothetical protein